MDRDETANVALCPFCGGRPTITERAATEAERHSFMCFIACMCGGYSARAHQYGGGETKAEAREIASTAWNRRASPTLPADVKGLVERLSADAPNMPHEETEALLREAAAALTSQAALLDELLSAAKAVMAGLDARIDKASANGGTAVPVFAGIAALHDAIGAASRLHHEMGGARGSNSNRFVIITDAGRDALAKAEGHQHD